MSCESQGQPLYALSQIVDSMTLYGMRMGNQIDYAGRKDYQHWSQSGTPKLY